jgi:hypothetical protein
MPKNFEDKPMFPLPIDCITIAEWCPNPDRENPTQVHLIIELEDADFSMVLRFKGTESLDKIINALIETRRRVFPDAPPISETYK